MSKSPLLDYWIEVVSIIEGGLKPDPAKVAAYAGHLANRLEQNGDPKLATRIRTLVARATAPAGSAFKASMLLADVEAQMDLAEAQLPSAATPYPILPDETKVEIQRFVTLRKRLVDLERSGTLPPATLLLHGPPGCGKTMAAQAIASDLGLPLLTIRLESVLASYLGSSAKNLRRLFDGAQSRPSILFLDEFDALGKMRDDPQEIGEIKRLVNSLLQNLDRVKGKLIIIAATNHPQLLDDALWRRFDVVVRLPMPGAAQAAKIIEMELGERSPSAEALRLLAMLAEGLSGAAITRSVTRATQDAVISPNKPLERLLAREFIRNKASDHKLDTIGDDIRSLVVAVREMSQSRISDTNMAKLLVTTPQNIHRIIKATTGHHANGEMSDDGTRSG